MMFVAVLMAVFHPAGSMMWSPRLVIFFSLMSLLICCLVYSVVNGEFVMGLLVFRMGDFLSSVMMRCLRLSGFSALWVRKLSLVWVLNCLGSARASRMIPPPRVPCWAPSRMTNLSPMHALIGSSSLS